MQISKLSPTIAVLMVMLATHVLTGCGQKGALYLPSNNSQQVVDAAAKPTSTTANASDTKVDVNTQDPNIMIDNNVTPTSHSAPHSATTPSVRSVGGKNDY
ncbi:lipoprotein [Moraxella sp. 179-F 1C4 NHS]